MTADPAALELLTAIVRRVRRDLDAAACSVALLQGESLVFTVADGAGAAEVTGLRIPVSRGIAGWAVVSGEAVAVADVRGDRRFDRSTAERTGYVPRSILAVPVDDGLGTVGVLEVLDHSVEDVGFALSVAAARQAALVVRLGALTDAAGDRPEPPLASPLRRQLDRLGSATPGEQRLVARLIDAVLDPDL